MLKVNLITGTQTRNRFLRQLDKTKFNDFEFHENSQEDIVWDFIVVYEELSSKQEIKFKKGGLIFISGEPPMSRVYSNKFLAQFDHLITAHPKIKHKKNHLTQQALDWHYGFDFISKKYNKNFEELKNATLPLKNKNISIISSNKKMMPGHRKRFQFLERLKSDFGNQIDFYGKGINPINDKAEALDSYKFHICIENSMIKDYWSEKFADPLLAYSIPIYAGCTNIESYFSSNCLIKLNIDNYEDCKVLIEDILKMPTKKYEERFEELVRQRNKLLDKYNIFNMLVEFYNKNIFRSEVNIKKSIYPTESFNDYKFKLYKLRLKRYILRFFN